MVRHASLFSQLIALFNRHKFYELVFRHKTERYSKGFNSWDHFVAMLLIKYLQGIEGGIRDKGIRPCFSESRVYVQDTCVSKIL